MGVDVFGRNTFGGGGFQCDVALKVARDAGVSAALFAPGWSYETNQDEIRWWDMVESCWPPARPDPVRLPFFTDFDVGHGRAKYMDGKQVSELPWNNLSSQNLQPLLHVAESAQHQLVVTTSQESAGYSGGVCIKVVGDVGHDEIYIVQLYHTDTILEEASVNVSYSIMAESESNFCLALRVQDEKGASLIYFLLDSKKADTTQTLASTHQFTHISAVFELGKIHDSTTGGSSGTDSGIKDSLSLESVFSGGRLWTVRDFSLKWREYQLIDVFGVCSAAKELQPLLIKLLRENETLFDGETFLKQEIRRKQTDVEQVGSSMCGVEETTSSKGNNVQYSLQLGHISIASSNHQHSTSSHPDLIGRHPSWLVGDGGDKFLSVNLCWNLSAADGKPDCYTSDRYHLFVTVGHLEEDLASSTQSYLGMTMLGFFYVYMLPVPKLSRTLTFRLSSQCACGKVQTNGNETSYALEVPAHTSGDYVRTQPALSDWLFRELH